MEARSGGVPAAVVDLSTTRNPFAPDLRPLVARHVEAGALTAHPDDGPARRALAAALDVDPGQVLVTNGGAEAVALLATEWPEGWVEEPERARYRRHLQRIVPGARRWASNPNDPTGRLADPGARAAVWDEASYPLATGTWTRGDVARGAAVVGSLTTLFACPGLRLGYVVAPDDAVAEALARRRPRRPVNGLAAAVLPELLALADLGGWRRRLVAARRELADVLRAHGLAPRPSDAPWVLVDGVPGLADDLAAHGVAVRDCTLLGLPGTVRVAVPDASGLERLDAALAAVTGGGGKPARGARRRTADGPGWAPGLRGAVLVCATASDAGKSALVTGLCRSLARRGVRVAPFKAQNMALNSWVTDDGAEIGRAQAVQAMAAGVPAEWAMNPVLLKPAGRRASQVVVAGRPQGVMDAVGYRTLRGRLLPTVLGALADLRSRFDVVVCEGAGSAAEINLLDGDFVNLGLARRAGLPAVVVGDIDRGGVFAALYGTVGVLPPELASRVGGFVINKFRGDPGLLTPAVDELAARTAVPVLGVVPWLGDLSLDGEDSLVLEAFASGADGGGDRGGGVDVAVVRLPHLSNGTDVDALRGEPGVSVRLVERPEQLGACDLVVLPGTKATVADLAWLRRQGLARALAERLGPGGPVVLAVCGGYQMAGRRLVDRVESGAGEVAGLGWLPVDTVFHPDKRTRRRRGVLTSAGLAAPGTAVEGYEIHHGLPRVDPGAPPGAGGSWLLLDGDGGPEPEGSADLERGVLGTSLHGLLEGDAFRRALLALVAARRGRPLGAAGPRFAELRQARFDRLADAVDTHIDLVALARLVATAADAP